ncbi:hypothetical protein Nepgr_024137 [Nepenthes gracilis]|uniref:Uncharacterized protein n=1 Tax=Nepenthes gracilis TaxID=150966 RepID=A0AAD3T4F9_NEPGR|nr:hypothetical protein Nepgr_024137 [Nepenthes gracilis]
MGLFKHYPSENKRAPKGRRAEINQKGVLLPDIHKPSPKCFVTGILRCLALLPRLPSVFKTKVRLVENSLQHQSLYFPLKMRQYKLIVLYFSLRCRGMLLLSFSIMNKQIFWLDILEK